MVLRAFRLSRRWLKLLRKEEWKNSGVYVFAKTYAMLNAISKLTSVCTVNSTTRSTCADHCRTWFALSDPVDPELQHPCPHQHQSTCEQCQGSSWKPYSSEKREDVLYDFDRAQSDILLWKAHIERSINQEEAKQGALKSEDAQSAILIMDCQQYYSTCSESPKCLNYVIRTITVKYYPTLSNSCASKSTVPKNVFLDFNTLALVLNRDSDQDSR